MKIVVLDKLFNSIMRSRAKKLSRLLAPLMNADSQVLNVGSGTGHNSVALRRHFRESNFRIVQTDVVDLSVVAENPIMIDGVTLPFDDNQFTHALMIYMLQYPDQPKEILGETARACEKIIVIQSTYKNPFGNLVLQTREFIWGRLAYFVSRIVGFIKPVECSLHPARFFECRELLNLFESCSLSLVQHIPRPWFFFGVNRDIYVLQQLNKEKGKHSDGS